MHMHSSTSRKLSYVHIHGYVCIFTRDLPALREGIFSDQYISKSTCFGHLTAEIFQSLASHFTWKHAFNAAPCWAHCSRRTRRNKRASSAATLTHISLSPFFFSFLIIDCLSCLSKEKVSSLSMVRTVLQASPYWTSIATVASSWRAPTGGATHVVILLVVGCMSSLAIA